jgi:hypothetical protein
MKASLATLMRLLLLVVLVALVASACGSSDGASPSAVAEPEGGATATTVQIPNRGDSFEGHTPRGFAGSGTGLFTGDNLNPNFPNGQGIQILLTFEFPSDLSHPSTATLVSDVLTVRGNAFEALGNLEAEPVSYTEFGPPLFELESDGPASTCTRKGDTRIECDVSQAVRDAVSSGASQVQLRVQFERESDSDSEQDLAMFFLSDSNTNEPGIFVLELS